MFGVGMLFGGLYNKYNSPEMKGERGERRLIKLLGNRYGTVFHNVNIVGKDKHNHQIDVVLVNNSGVYVFEVKNYMGNIYGSDTKEEWIHEYRGQQVKFYSPVLQNATHCKVIRDILPDMVPIHNVVVFNKNNAGTINSRFTYNLIDVPKLVSDGNEALEDDVVANVVSILQGQMMLLN